MPNEANQPKDAKEPEEFEKRGVSCKCSDLTGNKRPKEEELEKTADGSKRCPFCGRVWTEHK
jgi:uncharacterized Zn-finger protein